MKVPTEVLLFAALLAPGAALEPPQSSTQSFSCDATLLMRYAFDDPANPGIDSVSGNSAGLSGAIAVQNSYAVFNGGAVRLEPLTVLEGDDITFTWWMRPLSNSGSRNSFRIGRNGNEGRIQWYRATEWVPYMKTPSSEWVYESLDPGMIPFDSTTWSFVAWKIRASDGLWSITVNESEVFRGVKIAVHPKTYDDEWHHIGSIDTFSYWGAQDDFRIYRSFLSDEQVAAVRAGGPASACVDQGPPPGFTYQKRVTKVTATMSVPLTVEEFTVDAQFEYRETVAAVVGVHVDQVNIVSVTAE